MYSITRRRREPSSSCVYLKDKMEDRIQYCIFDPTGNITALVETPVDIPNQPAVASRIMELEPDVEQVGFVTYANQSALAEGDAPVSLRMAGGEFCGNATMCAAALVAIHNDLRGGVVPVQIKVKVTGTTEPLTVSLEQQGAFSFSTAVSMPPAIRIGKIELQSAEAAGASERMLNHLLFGMRSRLPDAVFRECLDAMEHVLNE